MARSYKMKGNAMPQEVDPRTLLAAERTYLAWLRTGLAMMGFGFVVARFGLFVRELQMNYRGGIAPGGSNGPSLWVGLALVGMGIFVEISATLGHRKLVARLGSGVPMDGRPSRMGTTIAILLSLGGLALMAYLL
ncbi:MAG: YidH family protein, partial [Acidobacteriaceae bacterium]